MADSLHEYDAFITYTASGLPRYNIEIQHSGLNKHKVVKGENKYIAHQKAIVQLRNWDEMWASRLEKERKAQEREERRLAIEDNKSEAVELTGEAEYVHQQLDSILVHTLSINDEINWEKLKDVSPFPEEPPQMPVEPTIPREPQRVDPDYYVKPNILNLVFKRLRQRQEDEAEERFASAIMKWKEQKQQIEQNSEEATSDYEEQLGEYKARESSYLIVQKENNSRIDAEKERYLLGDEGPVLDYCDMVLSNSEYPDYFPKTWELEYRSGSKLLCVNYWLPAPEDLPTLKQVRYIQSRDEFDEKHFSEAQMSKKYDSVIYQIILRSLHELFEADKANALDAIALNGIVDSIDDRTGKEVTACIVSIQVGKQEFEDINLTNVDPKKCFKALKGVGSSKLSGIAAVAPIVQLEKEDDRIVEGRAVTGGIAEGYNLATMEWQDFEHLVREVFENEFSKGGGEVHITRASRDRGVDAIAFDPDPIRGGKIVIQAKRYTGTVGVDAVRDLYGTVINEGATKGILITTSDYGPDAYEFSNGKPITLMNGGNLLHLLGNHGVKARIDLKEAKQLLKGEQA